MAPSIACADEIKCQHLPQCLRQIAHSKQAHLELFNSDGAIIVGIDGLEQLPQALDLFRGQAARHHHEGSLLQLRHARKLQAPEHTLSITC